MGECSYFVGNILVQVRNVFLSDYPLILFLLEARSVGVFWNNKKSGSNRECPLNSNINNVASSGEVNKKSKASIIYV